jgi:hypothetical protein
VLWTKPASIQKCGGSRKLLFVHALTTLLSVSWLPCLNHCPLLAIAALNAARQLGTADLDRGQQQATTPFVTKAACLYNTKQAGCTG